MCLCSCACVFLCCVCVFPCVGVSVGACWQHQCMWQSKESLDCQSFPSTLFEAGSPLFTAEEARLDDLQAIGGSPSPVFRFSLDTLGLQNRALHDLWEPGFPSSCLHSKRFLHSPIAQARVTVFPMNVFKHAHRHLKVLFHVSNQYHNQ